MSGLFSHVHSLAMAIPIERFLYRNRGFGVNETVDDHLDTLFTHLVSHVCEGTKLKEGLRSGGNHFHRAYYIRMRTKLAYNVFVPMLMKQCVQYNRTAKRKAAMLIDASRAVPCEYTITMSCCERSFHDSRVSDDLDLFERLVFYACANTVMVPWITRDHGRDHGRAFHHFTIRTDARRVTRLDLFDSVLWYTYASTARHGFAFPVSMETHKGFVRVCLFCEKK